MANFALAGAAIAADGDYQRALRLTREGQLVQALAILDELALRRPNDFDIARDRIVVLARLGRDADAVRLFEQLPAAAERGFVLEAAAGAYRNLRRYAEALALYRRGRARAPDNPGFIAGEIRVMTDLNDAEAALALADSGLARLGENLDLLLAAAYAAEQAQRPVDTLRYADRALRQAPDSRNALRQRVLALEAVGAPEVALRLAEQRPGLMAPDELRRLQGSAAAALVRWGPLEPPSEAERFVATDRALAELDRLIDTWRGDPAVAGNLQRARIDRLIALRDRARMAEAVAEYEALLQAGVAVPGYVLVAVGDAYMYLRQPQVALRLYRGVLEREPKHLGARLGVFHALVESEEFAAAIAAIDATAADTPAFIRLKGLPEPLPNPDKPAVDLAAANARVYADDLPEAERRIRALSDQAPANTSLRTGLANVYEARGWPRRALEELEIAQAQKPNDPGVQGAQARAALALRDWRAAEQRIADLRDRLPESQEAQQLDRDWRNHNKAEVRVSVEQAFREATNVTGGRGTAVAARVYSPPIDHNWRVFAGERYTHEQLPEGTISQHLASAGAEYRGRDIAAEAQVHAAFYDQDRFGGRLAVSWEMDDHWSLAGSGELFAVDTPLRALKNRITADAISMTLGYRASESRAALATVQVLPFSDGNLRSVVVTRWTERLYTEPRLRLDGGIGVSASHNTQDNVPYYNPETDVLAAFTLDGAQILYRHYDVSYSHRLTLTGGPYWEQGFGTGIAWSARYEHRLKLRGNFDAGLAASFGRQPYDGAYENSVLVGADLAWRF